MDRDRLARQTPTWVDDALWALVRESPVAGEVVALLAHRKEVPAAIRDAILLAAPDIDAASLTDNEVLFESVVELCRADTGIWPRVTIALARAAGVDPVALFEQRGPSEFLAGLSDEQRLWTGLTFGAPPEALRQKIAARTHAGTADGFLAGDEIDPGERPHDTSVPRVDGAVHMEPVVHADDPLLAGALQALGEAEDALARARRALDALTQRHD